jgi:hypothetical protein
MPHGRVKDSGRKVAGQVKDPLVSAKESCDRAKEPDLGAKEVLVASVVRGILASHPCAFRLRSLADCDGAQG